MKGTPPALSRAHYRFEDDGVWILQSCGWLYVSLVGVSRCKHLVLSSVSVWYADRKKIILDLSHLSAPAMTRVMDALREAVDRHRAAVTAQRQAEQVDPDQRP